VVQESGWKDSRACIHNSHTWFFDKCRTARGNVVILIFLISFLVGGVAVTLIRLWLLIRKDKKEREK